MIRCHILVEGQTEESFVDRLLVPFLGERGVHVSPVLLTTRRLRAGGKFGGGVSGWKQIKGDLRLLLGDSTAFVTTMLDYYGLPADMPGMADRPAGTARTRVEHVERSIHEHLGSPRLIPHVTLHEFEALLFACPRQCSDQADDPSLAQRLTAISQSHGGPELIDDGPQTAPSKRIVSLWPGYRKAADGPLAAERAGLAALRAACPHFDGWLTRIEHLADRD